jgi:hypothetical protein
MSDNNKETLGALWDRFNNIIRLPTPQVTVEAIMFAVRERGLDALKEPATRERLLRCDANARAQITRRIEKMKV